MGYILSNIAEVPMGPDMEFYVWLIGDGFHAGLEQVVRDNFHKLASKFKTRGAFIIPTEEASELWGSNITKAYFPAEQPTIMPPCLFITDSHPQTVRADSLKVFIPLEHVDKHFGSFDSLFADLVALVRRNDIALFKRIEEHEDWLKTTNAMIDLKPNLFGFGININAIVEKLRQRK